MSRSLLKVREGSQVRVRALIERYGRRTSTYLLADVRDAHDGRILTDHLWIEIGRWASGFRLGDQIEFAAVVRPYVKGRLGELRWGMGELDWGLSDVSDAKVTRFGPIARMMDDGTIQGG